MIGSPISHCAVPARVPGCSRHRKLPDGICYLLPYLGPPPVQVYTITAPQHHSISAFQHPVWSLIRKHTTNNRTPTSLRGLILMADMSYALAMSEMRAALEVARQATTAPNGHSLQPHPFPLMQLPRELRDIIYQKIAEDTHVVSVNQRLDYTFLRSRIPILQSSKLLEEDCIPQLLRFAVIELRVRHEGLSGVAMNTRCVLSPYRRSLFTVHPLRYEVMLVQPVPPLSAMPSNPQGTFTRLRPSHSHRAHYHRPELMLRTNVRLPLGAIPRRAMMHIDRDPAWYTALSRNQNLYVVFASRAVPAGIYLKRWIHMLEDLQPELRFHYRVQVPSNQRCTCPPGPCVQELQNALNLRGARDLLRLHYADTIVKRELIAITKAYERAGCLPYRFCLHFTAGLSAGPIFV